MSCGQGLGKGEMVREPSNYTDEVDFVCVLEKYGWCELTVLMGGERHTFSITDIFSNPILDIINFCDLTLDGEDGRLIMCDEPGTTIMEIFTDEKQKHLIQITFSVNDERPGGSGFDASRQYNIVLSFKMKRSQFLILMIFQLKKLHALCSEKSFSEERGEFPVREFLSLVEKWKTKTS